MVIRTSRFIYTIYKCSSVHVFFNVWEKSSFGMYTKKVLSDKLTGCIFSMHLEVECSVYPKCSKGKCRKSTDKASKRKCSCVSM